MKLSRLIQGLALEDHIGRDVEITSLTCDTRTLVPGSLFAAFPGTRQDGGRFIAQALERGAAAVLCQDPPPYPGPWLIAPDARTVFGQMACRWFREPAENLTLLGVTGTNGKTTTTYLLRAMLERVCSAKVGLIGTNQNLVGESRLPSERTTPDAYGLQALLARMKREGCPYGIMEVSSHALALRRTAGLRFRCGIFTNLTQDHLDFHQTMQAYYEAKARLFDQCDAGCFNLNDPAGRVLSQTAPCRRFTYGIAPEPADLTAHSIQLRPDGVQFVLNGLDRPVKLSIPGRFTVYNALGALSCGQALGLPLQDCAAALEEVSGVRGRAEVVPVPAPYTVVIDYAHTPDALRQILTALRPGTRGRLICLFGCGGDRDRGKRPIMGRIASELADLVVLTSDNPRTEDPEQIMENVASGFISGGAVCHRQPDRRQAIREALALCQAGDLLLLAGKGHETEQELENMRIHLDEREEITSFFQQNTV